MTEHILQGELQERFSHIIQSGKLSHAYLFSGQFGSFELALWLAQAVFCERDQTGHPCQDCRSCRLIAERSFSDLKIVEPTNGLIKTEQIRQMTAEFSKSSFEGKSQFFIIRDADKMHTNATNALLKFIEEPQSQLYILLLTDNAEKVLPTVRSRCQLVTFQKDSAYLEDYLHQKGLLLTDARVLAFLANSLEEADQLAENKKILDLAQLCQRFVQNLLSKPDLAYLEVSKLAFQANDKPLQDVTFQLLTYYLSQKMTDKRGLSYLSQLHEARLMWQANVSFQNALEYMVIK
ncbi:DNA polymerase III subunit delta' [Streptococcus loxodontisalivarius]|uniref:DNA polymerase-3 subunit delta n=1 Tax=Streptococcus loxodontisalivarius TaxID=1349415 RepID=A0ABS2PTZ2_9STRE|nr:DNA polymerase III subunit delta' [Streptococcus loxodontisalivarius]MBM7643509.1 DNA polymerase-3 subunit delta' [Streptococcus loxodontisalivarius]